ncbi:type II toxin-antitoxin system death-on-curing family toxin [Agrococcus sp. ARC_14]|uniref:type II toxin-antitoxin system death-on-curing family toxin n=1 Tax=Agrococcus sp. ARC_14 TaxID=2919927 RepID=UPI001F064786|nr:type II toxin-antitoxin system death-on-curing family toxin [Agrococcus sp. ARC_14]MCH1883214.1 type II toxin-antitoxin system death-on-curing family toxin [Agrococcus sp. ARC_14]
MTEHLSLDDLLQLISDLRVGPVRDVGALDAAAYRPSATIYGVEAYESLDAKAAALMESIVRGHPLVDGNKRLGWLAVVVLYGLNGVELDAEDDVAFDLVVGLAAGEITIDALTAALREVRR